MGWILAETVVETKAKTKKGGAREGAGAPPRLATQLKRAESLARRLRIGMSGGWEDLAKEYASLMRVAIALAKGKLDEDGGVIVAPNSLVLMRLLELLPKVAGDDTEGEDSPIRRLMRELKAHVTNIQVNVGQDVGEDGSKRPVRTENYTIP